MASEINLKSPSILVFGATVAGYAFAYSYELGKFAYFHVDTGFIIITPPQIFVAAITSLVAVLFIEAALSVIKSVSKKYNPENSGHRALAGLAAISLLALVPIVLIATNVLVVRSKSVGYLITVFAYLAIIVLVFYKAAYYAVKKRSLIKGLDQVYAEYDNAIKKDKKEIAKSSSESTRLSLIVSQLFIPGLYLALLCAVCVGWGYITSGVQDKYVTVILPINTNPRVVVQEAGNTIILESYNTKLQMIDHNYTIESSTGKTYTSKVLFCTNRFKSETTMRNSVRSHCPN